MERRRQGTAQAGIDYAETLPAFVTLPAGVVKWDCTITPLDDTEVEGVEIVLVTLVADAAYIIEGAAASAPVRIGDNENSGSLNPGDLNDDDIVDVRDLSFVLSHAGESEIDLGWDPRADPNKDGSVTVLDINIVLDHYGRTY